MVCIRYHLQYTKRPYLIIHTAATRKGRIDVFIAVDHMDWYLFSSDCFKIETPGSVYPVPIFYVAS